MARHFSTVGMNLFTVEQLELIRRLKCTGISPEAVVEAFQALDSIENELDVARVQSAALAALMPSDPLVLLGAAPTVAVTISSTPAGAGAPSPLSVHTVPLASTAASTTDNERMRGQRTPMKEITTLDDPQELEEFMESGEEQCISDMRQFITHFSLRQTTVAMMTGVSQPYISKLLNGNHRELSLRCRKNIYSWYLNCRRHPEKLSAFLADPTSRLETNGDGELIPQKRERYVFRPCLLRLLESFFHETPFPDLNRRIEIASACNSALQIEKKGVALMPKEVVSPQVVANWFANKRKELRRRSNEDKCMLDSVSGEQPCSEESSPSRLEEDDPMLLRIAPNGFPPADLRILASLGLNTECVKMEEKE